jgi:hypothetical protein
MGEGAPRAGSTGWCNTTGHRTSHGEDGSDPAKYKIDILGPVNEPDGLRGREVVLAIFRSSPVEAGTT